MNDSLGDRMKAYYEDRSRIYLPRRTYTVIRIDGKAFHTYTKGCNRPFDEALIKDMDETTKFLCENIQGVKLGYVQSDEISLVLTDFDKLSTSAWFDGNVQKIVSIAASLATAKFNQLRLVRYFENSPVVLITEDFQKLKLAQFDARVFTIPSREEVINYLIWRQQDATRNSISMVAQSLYSHKELNKKSTDAMQEMIFQKGQNWNDYPVGQKRGRLIIKEDTLFCSTKDNYERSNNKEMWILKDSIDPEKFLTTISYWVVRSAWTAIDPPIFTTNKGLLRDIIPAMN